MEPQYVIGIDLGTTNSALAFAEAEAEADPFAPANVHLLAVPQLVNPGEVRDEDLLPSFLYLPGASDFPAGTIALPWDAERPYVVGRLAQKRGVENAGRLVSSAKSWLSHSGVDRTAPLLPFRAPEGVEKISPVEASRRYLEHLREAWDASMPDAPFAEQQVLVTVPASFDAVARELTLEAAEQAGYQNVTLLEEPQAAFYAWIERHPDWRERVQRGRPDPGGGYRRRHHRFHADRGHRSGGRAGARPRGGGRAHPAGRRQYRSGAGRRWWRSGWRKRARASTAGQHQALWNNCRVAKEKLLDPAIEREGAAGHHPRQGHRPGGRHHQGDAAARGYRAGAGRRLPAGGGEQRDAGARSAAWACRSWDCPMRPIPPSRATWRAFSASRRPRTEQGTVRRGPSGLACPTHVLFNGGVLNAALVRERILAYARMRGWRKKACRPSSR